MRDTAQRRDLRPFRVCRGQDHADRPWIAHGERQRERAGVPGAVGENDFVSACDDTARGEDLAQDFAYQRRILAVRPARNTPPGQRQSNRFAPGGFGKMIGFRWAAP